MFFPPVLPASGGGGVTVTYSLLFQNGGRSRFELLFDSARFTVKGRPGKADCRVSDRRFPKLHLLPGDRLRVDCKLSLGHEVESALRQGDADGVLKIDAVTPEGPFTLTFMYRFRLEDVS